MDWYSGIDLAEAKGRHEEGSSAINEHIGGQ